MPRKLRFLLGFGMPDCPRITCITSIWKVYFLGAIGSLHDMSKIPNTIHKKKKKSAPLLLSNSHSVSQFLTTKGSFPKGSLRFENLKRRGFSRVSGCQTQQDHSQWIGLKFCSLWKTTGLVGLDISETGLRIESWKFEDFQMTFGETKCVGFPCFPWEGFVVCSCFFCWLPQLVFSPVSERRLFGAGWGTHQIFNMGTFLKLTSPGPAIHCSSQPEPTWKTCGQVWSKRLFFSGFCSCQCVGFFVILCGGWRGL